MNIKHTVVLSKTKRETLLNRQQFLQCEKVLHVLEIEMEVMLRVTRRYDDSSFRAVYLKIYCGLGRAEGRECWPVIDRHDAS